RLAGGRRERKTSPLLDATHVRIDGQNITAQRKVAHRRGGIGPNAREVREIVRPAVDRDPLRGSVQVQATPVVAESLPFPDDIRRRGGGKSRRRRPPLQPR